MKKVLLMAFVVTIGFLSMASESNAQNDPGDELGVEYVDEGSIEEAAGLAADSALQGWFNPGRSSERACGRCNAFGCAVYGGGCNAFGCYVAYGGCNAFGCWYPGGGCNAFGCTQEASKRAGVCR